MACVYVPAAIRTSGVIWTLHNWLNNSHCFSITIMTLAIDIIHTWAWPKRVAMQLQQRKTKALAINIAAGVLHAAHH